MTARVRGLGAMALLCATALPVVAQDCEAVKLAAGTKGEITLRVRVAASQENLPAFCRVVALLKPVPQSEIRIELWMPEQQWNGKLMGVGNGGFSGSISYPELSASLQRGYATVSTNTGHDGSNGSFAYQQPEKRIDFGYRAVHEMTVAAKGLVSSYYQRPARRTYFNGCSAGGRQGLQAAQRYPEDYDGIIAGAPAIDWTGRAVSALRVAQAVRVESGSMLDAKALAVLEAGALAVCDAQDGLVDGVIEAPQRCAFNPVVVQCAEGQLSGCLSPPQLRAAQAIYASPQNPVTGRAITGLYPGSEGGWATWGGANPFATAMDHFRFIVNAQPDWALDDFRFDRDVVRAEQQDHNTINALNPDLRPYFRRGGKLLQYHGWSDPQISPGVSPQYFEAVADKSGGLRRIENSYRLFMVPGMAHCRGGAGASEFDSVAALEKWVETGKPPERISAQRIRQSMVERSRTLCPYPQQARYDGKGDVSAAASFQCVGR
jgi:feruloyl esterase